MNEDGPLLCFQRVLAVGRGHAHLHAAEGREVVGQLALQRQPALFGERQCSDGGQDLGHRRQLEDGRVTPYYTM
jgi:hypothetical protein